MLSEVRRHAEKAWRYWLSRRSHKSAISWEKFQKLKAVFGLPIPRASKNAIFGLNSLPGFWTQKNPVYCLWTLDFGPNSGGPKSGQGKLADLDALDLDAAAIHVEASKGVVQLSGFVEKESQRQLARAVAQRVSGVKQVKNRIEVK